jgi:hypothetical protein
VWGGGCLLGLKWNRARLGLRFGQRDVGALLGPEGTTVLRDGGSLWAVVAGFGCSWGRWWSAGVVVKCRVDASIFFLDLFGRACPLVCAVFWFA